MVDSEESKLEETMNVEHKAFVASHIASCAEILSTLDSMSPTMFEVRAHGTDGTTFDFVVEGSLIDASVRGLKSQLVQRIRELEASYFVTGK